MKPISTSLAVLGLTLAAPLAHAQVVSYFNFNSLTGSAAVNFANLQPNLGNGSLSTNFGSNTNNVTAFSGTTINAEGSDVSGQALAMLGGSSGAGTPNNGGYLEWRVNTKSFSGLTVSYATLRSGTGFTSQQFSYSTDGGTNYTNFGAAVTPLASFASTSIDLSSITTLNNAADVRFRITFTGATSGSGNNRIDNLKLTAAAPGPDSLATLAIGAIPGIGLIRNRRRKK